jgi:hypothetical protein
MTPAPKRAPKRRWFRWSLRTMFVVVTLSLLFGSVAWCLNWIRQRHEIIATCHEFREASKGGTAPTLLWLFREPGYDHIELRFPLRDLGMRMTPSERDEVDRVRELFPEAKVDAHFTYRPLNSSDTTW